MSWHKEDYAAAESGALAWIRAHAVTACIITGVVCFGLGVLVG